MQELHAAVIQYLRFDQEEMEGWKKKARWSAALPKLQAGFSRDLKDVVKLTTQDSVSITGGDVFVGPDENQFDQNFDQGTSFEVKAVWYLDEVVFNRDSLMVSGEIRDWVHERNKTLQEATEAYFTRKRLIHELREKGIRVILVHPGAVATDIWKRAGENDVDLAAMLKPEDVADAVVGALRASPSNLQEEITLTPIGGDI